MIFSLSIKSVLRTPAKTVLFLLLIGAGIASLCLGIGMWDSADRLLEDADETYSTVAYVEYIGENFPDVTQFDDHMVTELQDYDAAPLMAQPEVQSADRQAILGATVEGLQLGNRGTAKFRDTGVFRFRVLYVKEEYYVCMITGDPLFAGKPLCQDGLFFNLYYEELREVGIDPDTLRKDEYYLTNGRLYEGEKRIVCFQILPCTLNVPEQYRELAACPLTKVEDPDTYRETEEFSFYYKIAETYRVLTNHLRICACDHPQEELVFYLHETELIDGDFYEPTEENVCLISEYLHQKLGIGIGDMLTVDLYKATEGRSAETSYWYDDGFLTEKSYRVVGIFQNANGLHSTVFIPRGEEEWLPESSIDYTVCRVKLDNNGVGSYLQAIEPHLLGNMRVTVYDQGYANVKKAIESMMETARLLTWVCGAVTLSLLLLFGWLFLQKQRESARIMLNLGSGRRRTLAYLYLSAGMVLAAAGIIGGLLGGLLSERVVTFAYENAVTETDMDYRFSSLATQGEVLSEAVAPKADPVATAWTAFGCVAAGIGLSGVFFGTSLRKYRAVRRRERKRKKGSVRTEVQTGTLGAVRLISTGNIPPCYRMQRWSFPLRLVLRSILRNRGKSIIVPLVSLVMVVFLGFFVADLKLYETRLNEVYTEMPVTAYVTSYSGRHIDNLNLTEKQLAEIVELGFVEESYYSQKYHYLLLDQDVSAGDDAVLPEEALEGGYAAETFAEKLMRGAYLIGTNHIETAPEFYFSGDPLLTFWDGYDAALFEGEEAVCLANQAFLDRNGIAPGDRIAILIGKSDIYGEMQYKTVSLRVVGTYPALSGRDNLYCPLSITERQLLSFDEGEYLYRDDEGYRAAIQKARQEHRLGTFTGDPQGYEIYADGNLLFYGPDDVLYAERKVYHDYHSTAFLLKDTEHLDDFKQGLSDLGYLPVGELGRIRRTVVINETHLVETVNSLESHIRYMNALFVVFEVLAVAIGFVVSYLLTKNRRAEFAMMRSQGAGRGRTFFTFAMEQFLLSLAGCLAGGAAVFALFGAFPALLWRALIGYAACYLVGIFLAAGVINRAQVLEILSVKE